MRIPNVALVTLAAALATAAASAQYTNQYPQPYNSGDPQNYGSPASQAYAQQGGYGQQQGYPQQQQGYPQQQQGYPQQQQGYPQQQQGYGQQPYNANAYDNGYGNDGGLPERPAGRAGPASAAPVRPARSPWRRLRVDPRLLGLRTPGLLLGPRRVGPCPPYSGALWTPGYWGDGDGGYFWNAGYWGPVVGFYGGIDYGFGYFGTGFYGGYWNGGNFFYNRAYWNVGRYDRFGYNQRFNGVGNVHPGGVSFAHIDRAQAQGFRGGAYNQHGFAQQGSVHGPNGTDGFNHGTNNGGPGITRGTAQAPQAPANRRKRSVPSRSTGA